MRGVGQSFRIDRPVAIALFGLPVLAGIVLGANQTRAGAYLPWGLSIIYWTAISVTTWWLFAIATQGTRLLLKPWVLPDWIIWVSGAVAGSFAARPAIYAIVEAFRPAMRSPVLREMVSARFDFGFVGYYLTNWSVIIAMWVVTCWWLRRAATAAPADNTTTIAPAAFPPPNGFLLRLPPSIGRDVVALQAEDHYVRVYTRLGNALVLGSLSDVIDKIDRMGIPGQRTHRSWWVASDAIVRHVVQGRHQLLVMSTDLEVPVSVTYRKQVASSKLAAA